MKLALSSSQTYLLNSLVVGDRPLTLEDWDRIASDLAVLIDNELATTDYDGEIETTKLGRQVAEDFDRGAFQEVNGRLVFNV